MCECGECVNHQVNRLTSTYSKRSTNYLHIIIMCTLDIVHLSLHEECTLPVSPPPLFSPPSLPPLSPSPPLTSSEFLLTAASLLSSCIHGDSLPTIKTDQSLPDRFKSLRVAGPGRVVRGAESRLKSGWKSGTWTKSNLEYIHE